MKNSEYEDIKFMIRLYCKKNHGKDMCEKCSELLEYAKTKITKCRYKESKTFCSVCNIHCYAPNMREQIKNVMKFSGPRMLIYRPGLAIKHMYVTIKLKRSKK